MLRVGLTGGIGSGKTTVAQLFAARGVPVIDTDDVARDVVRAGKPAHTDILRHFGPDVFDTDGELDRAKMRERVFNKPEERNALEAILHPRIRAAVRDQLALLAAPYVLVAVPLLIETGFDQLIDRILVVDCDETQQMQRVSTRNGLSADQIRRIMAAQTTRAERLARADDVIENNAGITQLEEQVARLHERYTSLATAT